MNNNNNLGENIQEASTSPANRKKMIGKYIAVIFLFILLFTFIALNIMHSQKIAHYVDVEAEVIDIIVKEADDIGESDKYAPIFKFTYEGKEYTRRHPSYSSPSQYSIGDRTTLSINPVNPDDFTGQIISKVYTSLIIVSGGVGLITLIGFIILPRLKRKFPDIAIQGITNSLIMLIGISMFAAIVVIVANIKSFGGLFTDIHWAFPLIIGLLFGLIIVAGVASVAETIKLSRLKKTDPEAHAAMLAKIATRLKRVEADHYKAKGISEQSMNEDAALKELMRRGKEDEINDDKMNR